MMQDAVAEYDIEISIAELQIMRVHEMERRLVTIMQCRVFAVLQIRL
jgi:hypothetical protein